VAGTAESVVMSMGGWKTAAMFRCYAIVSSADHVQAVQKRAGAGRIKVKQKQPKLRLKMRWPACP